MNQYFVDPDTYIIYTKFNSKEGYYTNSDQHTRVENDTVVFLRYAKEDDRVPLFNNLDDVEDFILSCRKEKILSSYFYEIERIKEQLEGIYKKCHTSAANVTSQLLSLHNINEFEFGVTTRSHPCYHKIFNIIKDVGDLTGINFPYVKWTKENGWS